MSKRGIKREILVVLLVIILFVNILFISAGELRVTNEHPFLINGNWVKASDLVVGDLMTTVDGKLARITGVRDVRLRSPVKVFNIEASGLHNFVVGDNGLVVHNSNSIPHPDPTYPLINLEIDSATKGKIIEAGKNIPDTDEYLSRGFIDMDHYFEVVNMGYRMGRVLLREPQMRYGPENWQQWRNAYDFLDSLSRGNCKGYTSFRGEITEDIIREVARNVPSQTVHESIAKVSLRDIRYRDSGVILSGDISLNYGYTVFKEETVVKYHANKFLNLNVQRLDRNFDLLSEIMSKNPRQATYLQNNANKLYAGRIEYPRPENNNVRNLMKELLERYNARIKDATTPEEVISIAADFQKDYVSIHPFRDKNGRTSRLLMDYILKSKGLPPAHLKNTLLDLEMPYEAWRQEVLKGVINAMNNIGCVQN